MPLLQAEADRMSRADLTAERAVVETIITVDQVFARLPFVPFNGKTYDFNREETLPTCKATAPNQPVTEDAGTTTPCSVRMKTIVGDARVDNMLEIMESDIASQAAKQVRMKAKSAGRTYSNLFINGDETGSANNEEFDGLRKILDAAAFAAQNEALAGNISFAALDILLDLVEVGMDKVFIMNSRTIRSYYELVRAMGGANANEVTMPGVSGPVPTYRGVPILKSDWIPTNIDNSGSGGTATDTEVMLAGLDEDEGVHGLMPRTNAGVQINSIGQSQTYNAEIWRVVWYASLAVESTRALARLTKVAN